MSLFTSLFSLIGLAIGEASHGRRRAPTASTASNVAARHGLRVVEGDPTLDLGHEVQVRLGIDPLGVLGGSSHFHVRLEGERRGHRVEVLHLASTDVEVDLFGTARVSGSRDVRASVYARTPIPAFELTSPSHRAQASLPIAGSLRGGADGPCTVRTRELERLDAIRADLEELASVGYLHLSCDGYRLSLIEAPRTGFLSLYLDRFLPVMERIVLTLEGDLSAHVVSDEGDGPTSIMPVQWATPETPTLDLASTDPLTRCFLWMTAALASFATFVGGITDAVFGRAPEEPEETELGRLVAVFPALGSRIVVRDDGFERHVGSKKTSSRYDEVVSFSFTNGLLTAWLPSGERIALDGSAAERVRQALDGRAIARSYT